MKNDDDDDDDVLHVGWFIIFVLICFSVAFLTGCSTTKQKEFVEVKVPVRVACSVETPTEPEWAVPFVSKGSDVFIQMRALLSDRELSLSYQDQLRTALTACKQ